MIASILAWAAAVGAVTKAYALVILGVTLGAPALFCLVLFLAICAVIGGIVWWDMRGKCVTEV